MGEQSALVHPNYDLIRDEAGPETLDAILRLYLQTSQLLNQAAEVDVLLLSPWRTVPFAAGNFTGNNAMTWTLTSGDQLTFAYIKVAKTMIVSAYLTTTSVGGTPDTLLQIAIPGGHTADGIHAGPFVYVDNAGARAVGRWSVNNDKVISLQRIDGAAWAASANLTDVYLSATFKVR